MRRSHPLATAPTAAERTRSILAAAHSMTVVSDGRHAEVHRLDGEGAMGHVHLHAPLETGEHRTGTPFPVKLELTDIAPTPVRDRLRARVTLTGLLAGPYDPAATGSTCMEFGQAILEDAAGRTYITLQELEDAELDPVATSEASLLTHLLDDHSDLVPRLLRLVRPAPDTGVLRALPVALDRYGLTLRLEYPRTHRDVRVPFRTPLAHLDHIGPQIHALLSAARRLSHTAHLLP
ncbi:MULTISPECIES: DUF2470 domain-containing protein [Streptomyces]|uniref:DUF2470 domain-containing protein n=1 Tax=Streptomyces antibioticus TaxID=1890 RepID=A0AAE6YG47_STRAT|nr:MULTISPECIES: DUF2470 domain-containing protein [Streptomyces]MBO7939832.1 DUF2470 domain-containing protein [Streptomyces sp. S9]MCX4741380.1 DUF2470 domain-containing protein [Streptomyces antibioticus]MCX5173151.1 DUF2470 domain-containing protein [Streptomyces antibioticus]NUV58340.1 DUF2470 domain-containing protein [Streptomyces sp. CAI-85]OOQ47854.1 hypothetical protein AFM16_34890 [Streptomyces antibioticus]